MGTVLGLGKKTVANNGIANNQLCKNAIGAGKIAISGKINNENESMTSGGTDNVPPWRVTKTSASKIASLNNEMKKEEVKMEVGRIGGGLNANNRRKGILGLGANANAGLNSNGGAVKVGAVNSTSANATGRVMVGGTRPQVGVGTQKVQVQPRTVQSGVTRGNTDANLQKLKSAASKLLGRFLEMAYDLTEVEEQALLEMMEVLDLKDALLSAGGLGTTSPINAQVILDCVDEINQVMACNTAVTSNNVEAANNIYSKLDSLTVSAQSGVYNEPDLVEILAELYIANMINLQDSSKPNLNYCFNTLKNRVLNMCGGNNQRVGTTSTRGMVTTNSIPSGVRTIGTTSVPISRSTDVQSTQVATPTSQPSGGKLFIRPTRTVSNQFTDRGTGLRNNSGIGSGIRRPIGSGVGSRIGTKQEMLRPTGITLGNRGAGTSRINVADTSTNRGGSGLLSRRTVGNRGSVGVNVNVADRRTDTSANIPAGNPVMNYLNL